MTSLLMPPLAFAIMLGLAWGIKLAAGHLAPAGRPEHGKYRHYACGEDLAMSPVQPNYARFFAVAFAYSAVHVSILTVAAVPRSGAPAGAAYLAMVLFAVIALITELDLIPAPREENTNQK